VRSRERFSKILFMAVQSKHALIVLVLIFLCCAAVCVGQSPPATSAPGPSGGQPADPQSAGSILGTVLDRSGAVVAGARVRLTRDDQTPAQEALSGANGQFSFNQVAPGPFRLTITSGGFGTQVSTGVLRPGQSFIVPTIALEVATANTEVQAIAATVEIAQEQIKVEEQQRVLRIIPNFYVTYVPDAAPLNSRQKFELAWKAMLDPFTFGAVGVVAGVQQSQNSFRGYGQGAQGYAKRYGAAYGNVVSGTFIGAAILPSLLKQDPRYFYKGTGSTRSRFFYALANAVICKGDNGRWQVNYSNIVGNLAAGAISNFYYAPEDRDITRLTFENGAIGIATTGAANVFEELVIRKFTRHVRKTERAKH
jgi:Carboxypeptidase regulatory-like domain